MHKEEEVILPVVAVVVIHLVEEVEVICLAEEEDIRLAVAVPVQLLSDLHRMVAVTVLLLQAVRQ